ncbi:hypothetical protein G7K_1900-t1 [Saitoella complicata NRRL Y-17804]|uniref:Uncharacterized protein n=1 Tax=Saitoella complicata (strain BCRC 22490 / CBS 7301 / JCM 7358 / NBRC 10748 / NRRL Y-17804) TaxID=698492 RepID=A0A0E9NDA6_SAICN|nr:hypothetical protein G7K_1900-t1 [Saitoella complicata NRRL Y-17804]
MLLTHTQKGSRVMTTLRGDGKCGYDIWTLASDMLSWFFFLLLYTVHDIGAFSLTLQLSWSGWPRASRLEGYWALVFFVFFFFEGYYTLVLT